MTMGLPQAESRSFLGAVREWALIGAGLLGNPLDAFLTRRDLKDAGIIDVRSTGAIARGSGSSVSTSRVIIEPAVDLTPPPAPGGFAATAGITQILFETAAPVYRQGHGHARTKVYAAPVTGGPLPTFADAVLYTDFPGNVGVAPFDPASSLRLWATWTSVDGQESEPAGGTNGVAAATGLLDSQHIASLVAGKILAGSLAVGQYIQSADYVAATTGWRIQTLAGGGAFMEINGGATIGGLQVGATYIQSSNYVLNTTGYRFNSNGTAQIGGFAVTTTGIQSTNYAANTSGWLLKNDGTGQIGGFVIGADFIRSTNYVAGTSGWHLTLAGDFEARSGTFSGTLTAAQINVGPSSSPVTFYDPSIPSVTLWSIAHGQITYNGNTLVVVGGVNTWPPVTGTGVTFTCGNALTPIERRVRTGTVRFAITFTGVVDHYFSLWYRVNSGAWTYMYEVQEPQPGYGAIAATSLLDRSMASGDVIEFGMAVTNSLAAPLDPASTEIRFGSLTVQAINF